MPSAAGSTLNPLNVNGRDLQVIENVDPTISLGIDFPGFVKELEEDGLPTELATPIALQG